MHPTAVSPVSAGEQTQCLPLGMPTNPMCLSTPSFIVCCSTRVEVTGPPTGASFSFYPVGPGSNSSGRVWWQTPLPTQPSCQIPNLVVFKMVIIPRKLDLCLVPARQQDSRDPTFTGDVSPVASAADLPRTRRSSAWHWRSWCFCYNDSPVG